MIRLKEIHFLRGGNSILSGIDWEVKKGEHWVMLGPNGAGKSTIISLITGYQWKTTGHMSVMDMDFGKTSVQDIRKKIGLFQPTLQLRSSGFHPGMTALDVILMGYDGSLALYHDYEPSVVQKARSLFHQHLMIDHLNIPEDRDFVSLSSGEQRKVILLRSMMNDPELLILDEPYESLDIPSRLGLEHILSTIVQSRTITTITVLHRLEEIPMFSNHALLLKEGRVFQRGLLEDVIHTHTISELYDHPIDVGKQSGRYYIIPRPLS